MLTAMKVATPDVPSPLSRAYTGPIEKMVDEARQLVETQKSSLKVEAAREGAVVKL